MTTIHQGVFIPFTSITRIQLSELMNISPSTVDKYAKEGYKTPLGFVRIRKQKNGSFLTSDVQDFINEINKYRYEARNRKRKV